MDQEDVEKRFPKIDVQGRRYTTIPLHAPGETRNGATGGIWKGVYPPEGRHWRSNPDEFDKLDAAGLIEWSKNGNPRIIKYADEHLGSKPQDIWKYKDPQYPKYPTEKNHDMLSFIINQCSSKNSIVMDCFAGGGSTLINAQKNGRRWIGIDESEVAVKTIFERIDIESFNFVNLKSINKKIADK